MSQHSKYADSCTDQCRQVHLAVPFYCGVVVPAFQVGVGKSSRAKDQRDLSTALALRCSALSADAESKTNETCLRRTVQIWQLATREQLAARKETNLYHCLPPPVTRCRPCSTSKIDYHTVVPDLRMTYVNRPDNDLEHETSPDSDYTSMKHAENKP